VTDPTNVFIALIHHPVYNKSGEVVTTAITNLDLHDISRVATTFGLGGYFVVNPMEAQRALAARIASHWLTGFGHEYNPNRSEALGLMHIVPELSDAVEEIRERTGKNPRLVATAARDFEGSTGYAEMRGMLSDGMPTLVMFGTGWGMTDEFVKSADVVLEPIRGAGGYNHLPVRSAVSIILDRLLSVRA